MYIILFECIELTEEKRRYLINFVYKINLIVLGSGQQQFLNVSYNIEPTAVIINNEQKNAFKKSCEFDNEFNNVTIFFDSQVPTCSYMFSRSTNIKEIDLSNFDFSGVTSMIYMFRDCTQLEIINFGNIKTSQLNNMQGTFQGCSKLSSLDISKFDTSLVTTLYLTFSNCKNLLTLNLGKMNTKSVKTFRNTFSYCEKLESIDISSFDTSSAESILIFFFIVIR